MKRIFYGAAIQGAANREERALVHEALMGTIKDMGGVVVAEHTAGKNFEETALLMEQALGPIPSGSIQRAVYVRNRMIAMVEGNIDAAVFEVSTPSLGTGVEIAHAYLRPRLGLTAVPVLALYEKGYWIHNLSSMIRGLDPEEFPHFAMREYGDLAEAQAIVAQFLLPLFQQV